MVVNQDGGDPVFMKRHHVTFDQAKEEKEEEIGVHGDNRKAQIGRNDESRPSAQEPGPSSQNLSRNFNNHSQDVRASGPTGSNTRSEGNGPLN